MFYNNQFIFPLVLHRDNIISYLSQTFSSVKNNKDIMSLLTLCPYCLSTILNY